MKKSQTSLIDTFKRQSVLQMMTLPGIVFLLIFCYIPMFGIIIAFKDYNIVKGFVESPWVGFEHFVQLFADYRFFMALKNTVVLSIFAIIFGFPAPLIFALILSEVPFARFKKITQTCSYLPHFISYVVVATMWILFLDSRGIVNKIIVQIGLVEEPIIFLGEPSLFAIIATIIGIWKGVGFSAIIYLAALSGVNPELYEAAIIDGASRIKKIVHITLPSLKGLFFVLAILSLGGLFRGSLDQSYLLGNVFNREVSYVIEHYTLDTGLSLSRYSYATAINFVQSVLSVLVVFSANWLSGKFSGEKIF